MPVARSNVYKFPSIAKAAAASMTAGTDINCGTAYKSGIPDAIESKLLDEIVLNEAISRTLLGRFEVGQFDPLRIIHTLRLP